MHGPLPPRRDDASRSRRPGVHLLAIDEQPAWNDAALAHLFAELRHATGLSREALADAIGTSVVVVDHLEAGRVRALPPWPETERAITAYGRLVSADVRPILLRLRHQTVAGDATVATSALPSLTLANARRIARDKPPNVLVATGPYRPHDERGSGTSRRHGPERRAAIKLAFGKRTLSYAFLVLAIATAVTDTSAPIALVRAAIQALPAQLSSPLQRRLDRWFAGRAPSDAGFVWVEADDPAARKADKLPSPPGRR